MSDTLKVGIIGIGILGSQHARNFSKHEKSQVVSVADPIEIRAQDMAKEVGAKAYADFKEMLSKEQLDLVVVATPDPLHKEPFLAGVNSGVKAILSEKPLATTVADAEEMMEAADKAGVQVYINFANRFNLMDIATKYVMQQGLIGRPVYGEIRLDDNISVPTRMWGERSVQWASGSSTAHFLLSHVSDLLRWYLEPAEVEAVYAISQYEVLKYTPDLYDAFLFWNNGIKTRVKAEWIKHIDSLVEFYICLGGEKGGIVHHKSPGYSATRGWRATLDRELSSAQLQQAAAALEALGVKAKGEMISDATRNGEGTRGILEITESGSKNGTDLFIKSILEEYVECTTPNLSTGKDGFEAVKIVNAIVESAESGKLVKIQS